jgi:glutamate--cysteine ligase
LRAAVPRLGLKAPLRGGTVRDVARDVVALAHAGLARRARRDLFGKDESKYLKPLTEIVETGRSAADRLLADYRGPWDGDIDKVFATAVL